MYYHDNIYGKRLPGERYIQEEGQNSHSRYFDERRETGRHIVNLETPNFLKDAENIKVRVNVAEPRADPLLVRETESVLVRERDLKRYHREFLDDGRYREEERFAGPNHHFPEPRGPPSRMPYFQPHASRSHIPPIRGGPTWQENYRNHHPTRRRHHLDDIYFENYDEEEANETGFQSHPAYRPPPIRVAVPTEAITKDATKTAIKNEVKSAREDKSSNVNKAISKESQKTDASIKDITYKSSNVNKAISKNSKKTDVSLKDNTSNNTKKIVKDFSKPTTSDSKGTGEKQNKLSEQACPTKPTGTTKESKKTDASIKDNTSNNIKKNVKDFSNPTTSEPKGTGEKQSKLSEQAYPTKPTGTTVVYGVFNNAKTKSENTNHNDFIKNKSDNTLKLKNASSKTEIAKIPLPQTSNQGTKSRDQSKFKCSTDSKNLEPGCNESSRSVTKNKDQKLQKPDLETTNTINNSKNQNAKEKLKGVEIKTNSNKDCCDTLEEVENKKKNDEPEADIVKELEELVGSSRNTENAISNLVTEQQNECLDAGLQKESVKEAVESNAQIAVEEHATPNTTLASTSLSPQAIKKDIKINLINSPQPTSPVSTKSTKKSCSPSESTNVRPIKISNEAKSTIDRLSLKRFNNVNDRSVTPVSTHSLLEGTKIQEEKKILEGSKTQEQSKKGVILEDIFILEDEIKKIDVPCEIIEVPSSPTKNDNATVSVDNKKIKNSCEKIDLTTDKKESTSKQEQPQNVQILKEKISTVATIDNTKLGALPIIINVDSPNEDSRSPTNLEIRKTFEQNERSLGEFGSFHTRDSFLWTFHQQFDDPRVVDMEISNTPSPSKNLVSPEEPAKTEQQKVSDRVIQDMDALWKEISNDKSDNSNSESEINASLRDISRRDKIREKIKLFKSQIIDKNVELLKARESNPKEKNESKILDTSGNTTPTYPINDSLNNDLSHRKISKNTEQCLKTVGNLHKRNNLRRSSSFVAINKKTFKQLRKTKSCNDLSCDIKVESFIVTKPNDIIVNTGSLEDNCSNETSKISYGVTSPKKVSDPSLFTDYRDELLSLLCSKPSDNILESSDAITNKEEINKKTKPSDNILEISNAITNKKEITKVKKRKRAMRIESSDDEAPGEKQLILKTTEPTNKNDIKIKYNEKTKEIQTQQVKKDEKYKKQTAFSPNESLGSTESEQQPTKYLTKAEYVKAFAKNKSPVPDISLSISAVPKLQNIKKRRATFTCETDNETILKKINSELHYKQKFLRLFGSVSEDEEDIVPLPTRTSEKSLDESESAKEGSTNKSIGKHVDNKEKEGLSELSESSNGLSRSEKVSKKPKRSSDGFTSNCKRKKYDIESARGSKEKSPIKNQESPENKKENLGVISSETKNKENILNHRTSTSSRVSTDSKPRHSSEKNVTKEIKLSKDVKRVARSQSKESDTSPLSDTGDQELIKHKEKLVKICGQGRRDSSSSNASCKSESDQPNDSKSRHSNTNNVTKKIKLSKDVKRVARSQSREFYTSPLSDTGDQELIKHKEKLVKICGQGRRDSSSSNASCKSESDQPNDSKLRHSNTNNVAKKIKLSKDVKRVARSQSKEFYTSPLSDTGDQELIKHKEKLVKICGQGRRDSSSSNASCKSESDQHNDSKSRHSNTNNVTKETKLSKDVKRVARSQSKESDTSPLSDSGGQEIKHKEKLAKICGEGRRDSSSSNASCKSESDQHNDSKSRHSDTKNVTKKIKLSKDLKRVVRSQSKESDTSPLSDTGGQELKHKEKLVKTCGEGRRDSSSSNASCKSESDKHNKRKDADSSTKKVEKCKKPNESNQPSTHCKNEKEYKKGHRNNTKPSTTSKNAIQETDIKSKQQKTCNEADKTNSKLPVSLAATLQSNKNVSKKDCFISFAENVSSMKIDKVSTKPVEKNSSLQLDQKVKPIPLKHLKESHRRYSAPDTINSFVEQSGSKNNNNSFPVYRSSENEVNVILENCRPFVLEVPKFNKVTKITKVDNECTDMAYINEKPDIYSEIKTVTQSVSKDDDDVIEIRPKITMIDLTDDQKTVCENSPEKNVGFIKLKTEKIIDDEVNLTNTITLHRSEEDSSIQGKNVEAVSVTLSPAETEKIVSLKNTNVPTTSSNKVAEKEKINAEVTSMQSMPDISENSNETASAAASQSFSSLVQNLEINSDVREETNSDITTLGSSDNTNKNTNLSSQSNGGPDSTKENATFLRPQESLMSLEDENQRAITSILEVTNTNQVSSGSKNTQRNLPTEPNQPAEHTILNFSANKSTNNTLSQSTDALFRIPSNVFKSPRVVLRPTRAENNANSSGTQAKKNTVLDATANQNAQENQSFGQHRGLPQTLKEHRPVQRVVSVPPVPLNMNRPQTSSQTSTITGTQFQPASTSQVLSNQNVSLITDLINNEVDRSETVQNRPENSGVVGGTRTSGNADPVIDLTEEGGDLSMIDRRLIIDIFTRHVYFLAHLCKAQNGYIEYLRTQPYCQNYFKAEITLFEGQKQARLDSQSLRLMTELQHLNIRASRNLSVSASEIVEQITVNLGARNMPKPTTLSMTYLLIGQLIKPQSKQFAKIPLFKALYRLCNIVVSKIYSKYPGQLTDEQRNILIQQINDYNRIIVGSSTSFVDQSRSQSNAQTLHTGLNNLSTLRSNSVNANNTSALRSNNTMETNQISSRQVPNSGQTFVAGPTQHRLRFVLPKSPKSQQSFRFYNPSQSNVLKNQNLGFLRNKGPPNVTLGNLPQSRSTVSNLPNMMTILRPTGNIGPTSVRSNLMNPPAINDSTSSQLRSIRMRQPSAIVVPNNSHQVVRCTQDLPGGANTNTLGCTPRYFPNYDTPQQGHMYTSFARPRQQTSSSSSTGQRNLENNLQRQTTHIGNSILESLSNVVMASTPQRNTILQSPRNNDIFQSPSLVLSRTPIYRASMGPPPSYEETVSNSSRQSPSATLAAPSPPSEEVKKRSENLLRELLSTTNDESLFAKPPSPVNDSFLVKLPFTTPTVTFTTTTITTSANVSSTSVPVIVSTQPSQAVNTGHSNSGIQSTVSSQPNYQTSLECLESGETQTPVVLVNNAAASTCFVVGQSKSPVVLNQGLAALSSIGQASAMLNSSHQGRFGQRTPTPPENVGCVDYTQRTNSTDVVTITKSSGNKPKSNSNVKFKVVQAKSKVVKKKTPKAKPKPKGRGRPAKQKKDVYSKSIEIVNLLSSSDEETPLNEPINISSTSNDQVISEVGNGNVTFMEHVIREIVNESNTPEQTFLRTTSNDQPSELGNGNVTSNEHVISEIVKESITPQQINISTTSNVTSNEHVISEIVKESITPQQINISTTSNVQPRELGNESSTFNEHVSSEIGNGSSTPNDNVIGEIVNGVVHEQAETGRAQVEQISAQNTKSVEDVVREDETDTIDLTWIDDMETEDLQREMDFVFVKKEEPTEEEQNPNNNDDGMIYTTEVQQLCVYTECTGPAVYNCVCGEASYCGQECQFKDWASHEKVCHIAHKARETEEEPIHEEVEVIDDT